MNNQSIIELIIKPNKSKTRIVGIKKNGIICMDVKSPPIGDKANNEMIHYLAKILGIYQSQIIIIRGMRSRNKILKIRGIEKIDVNRLVQESSLTHHI